MTTRGSGDPKKKIPREFSPLPGVAVVYRLKAVGGIAPLAAIFRLYLRIRSHIRQAVLYVTPNCRWTSSAATPFRDVVKRNMTKNQLRSGVRVLSNGVPAVG